MSSQKIIPHDSAITHVTGESQFIDDVPPVRGELIVGVVTSLIGRGQIVKISTDLALKIPGIVGIYTAKDLQTNLWGPIVADTLYSVVTNNYVRGGGDGFKMFATDGQNAYDYGPSMEDVVAEYLAKSAPYKPYTDGRIASIPAQ